MVREEVEQFIECLDQAPSRASLDDPFRRSIVYILDDYEDPDASAFPAKTPAKIGWHRKMQNHTSTSSKEYKVAAAMQSEVA